MATRINAGPAGYSVSGTVAAVLSSLCGGLPSPGSVWVRPMDFFHRVNIPVAGVQQQSFFNQPKALHITNLDQPGQFPSNYGFAMRSLRFEVLPGIDNMGNRLGLAAPTGAQKAASSLSVSSATDLAPAAGNVQKWVETIREFMSQAQVQLTVADKLVLDHYGLLTFPSGEGLSLAASSDSAISDSTAATAHTLQNVTAAVSNGAPVRGNQFLMDGLYPIMPGQQFALTVTWPKTVNWADADLGPCYGQTGVTACTLKAVLSGRYVTQA